MPDTMLAQIQKLTKAQRNYVLGYLTRFIEERGWCESADLLRAIENSKVKFP